MSPITTVILIAAAMALLYRSTTGESTNPAPSPRPRKRRRGKRITSSTLDANKTVLESPAQLLAQARQLDPDVTLDEMTAARLIASELGRGSFREMCAIADAELNRAASKRRTLTDHLTSAGTYGKQGGRHGRGKKRPASTRQDPTPEHLSVARAVINGEYRGISQGAVRFFDPVSQWKAHRRWLTGKSNRRHCHPLVILRRWTHDLPWDRRGPPCALQDKPGHYLQEWVGHIDGINPLRLMLLRPAEPGDEHRERYEQAHRLIAERFPTIETIETTDPGQERKRR